MKFPKYCKWCLICLIPVAIFGIPLFIRDGLSLTTFIAFSPLLLCPVVMGIAMGKMCEEKSCEKEETKNVEGGEKGAAEGDKSNHPHEMAVTKKYSEDNDGNK